MLVPLAFPALFVTTTVHLTQRLLYVLFVLSVCELVPTIEYELDWLEVEDLLQVYEYVNGAVPSAVTFAVSVTPG